LQRAFSSQLILFPRLRGMYVKTQKNRPSSDISFVILFECELWSTPQFILTLSKNC